MLFLVERGRQTEWPPSVVSCRTPRATVSCVLCHRILGVSIYAVQLTSALGLLFNATEVVFVGLPRRLCGLPIETHLEGRESKFST